MRAGFVVGPLAAYGVPRGWWDRLGAVKLVGAVVTVLRARAYGHVPFPLVSMAPAAVLILA
ncbi:hypothetical protein [Streptomyces sp. bgisy095]|uniref:hypothetical protein n=1 Tax=unclassified Streptomyces TaxID=2593676 RepID=UPI003D735B10